MREERRRILRRRAIIAAGVLLLAGIAMAQPLRENLTGLIARGMTAVQTMALPAFAQAEITLPQKTVYALQLGAYDNGAHAQDELVRLGEKGVRCVIWQREQMRLVCDAALAKGKLDTGAAQGCDAWVLQDTLPEVVLRAHAQAGELDAVRSLLTLPDQLFASLCTQGEALGSLIAAARGEAERALGAHTEHALYTQLAQSLVNWCNLMDSTMDAYGEEATRSYARVTMCTLCCELRQALQAQSAASAASAQRTPSTAADVMPPA